MWKKFYPFKGFQSTICTLNVYNKCYFEVDLPDIRGTHLLNTRRDFASSELQNEQVLKRNSSRLEKRLLLLDSDIKKVNKVYKTNIEHILHDLKTEDLTCATQIPGVLLLRCCGSLLPDEVPDARIQLVHSIWSTLQTLGIDFNIEHYNALLGSYIENKHQILVKQFLSKMGHVQPNETTYLLLLACVCEAGDVDQAAEVIAQMKAEAHPVSEAVFNSLILGHARARDMKSAQYVLEMMRTAQISLSSNTYTALIQGYAELGDLSSLSKTLKGAEAAGIQFTEKQFMEIVKSLAVSGHEELITKILPKSGLELTPEMSNAVVHLVHLGHEHAAFLLLSMVPPDSMPLPKEVSPTFGAFFIQEMVKANRPVTSVVTICDNLAASGRHTMALSDATKFALLLARTDMALVLLRAMKERDLPLRPHFFWPLILVAAKHVGEEGVFNTLEHMQELSVGVDYDTLVDYVLPHASLAEPQALVRKLQMLGLRVSELLSPVVTALLKAGQIQAALKLCDTHRGQIDPGRLLPVLVKTFLATGDVSSTTSMVQEMVRSSPKESENWPGQFLLGVLASRKAREEPELVELCIKKFEDENLQISTHAGDMVTNFINYCSLSEEKKTRAQGALRAIITAEPSFSTSDAFSQVIPHPRNMNIEDLECHLVELKAKNLNTRGVLRRLFQLYSQKKNVKGALHIKQEFEASGFEFSAGMQASLLDLYIQIGSLDEAESCLLDLTKRAPHLVLDEYKIVDFAALLVANNKYKAAVAALEKHAGMQPVRGGDVIARNCSRLLQAVAERGEPPAVRHMLEVLLTLGYCSLSNALLGPLVRAHLINGSLLGAVREYMRCVTEHRQTPLQYELLCRLVQEVGATQVKDAQKLLQEVLDATQKIHGVHSTRVTLALALAETGRTKQLRRMLVDSNITLKPSFLWPRCKRLADEDKLDTLENLAVACKGLPSINMSELFMLILQVHSRRGNYEGAMALWTRMQDLNIQPSPQFLATLASLLQSHKQKVPFCVPTGQAQICEMIK